MFSKVIWTSFLLTSSLGAIAHEKGATTAAPDQRVLPYLHECTVSPDPIATEFSNPIPSIGVVVKKNTHRTAAPTAWDRIDLQFDVAAPSPGGTIPTVTGHAINTKGTGTSSGRSAKPDETVQVSCAGRALAADAVSQKVAMQDLHFFHRGLGSAGWTCAVTGTEDSPQFTVKLHVPSTGGQASKWSLGESNSGATSSGNGLGSGRVSIVPRGSTGDHTLSIACASSTARSKHYDLAVAKACTLPSQSRQQINKSKSNVKNNRTAADPSADQAPWCNDF